jgi:hypothetical protein
MLFSFGASANYMGEDDRLIFIDSYSYIAVEEMHRSGIPASIKLGQAILESNWGQGATAVNANNLFCIKCSGGWEGETFYKLDDEATESCFRVYASDVESFRDHSEFLRANPRYGKLFGLGADYIGWAKGLKECGYATDEKYAEKLITIIEDYALYVYDFAMPAIFPVLTTQEDFYPTQGEQGAVFADGTEDFTANEPGQSLEFYPSASNENHLMPAPAYFLAGVSEPEERDEEKETPASFGQAEASGGRPKILPVPPVHEVPLETGQ